MGLIAHQIEKTGISTISFGLTRQYLESTMPPRSLFVKWPFGHPLGEPDNKAQQLTIIYDALKLLLTCDTPGTILDLPYKWKRHEYIEPDFDSLKKLSLS